MKNLQQKFQKKTKRFCACLFLILSLMGIFGYVRASQPDDWYLYSEYWHVLLPDTWELSYNTAPTHGFDGMCWEQYSVYEIKESRRNQDFFKTYPFYTSYDGDLMDFFEHKTSEMGIGRSNMPDFTKEYAWTAQKRQGCLLLIFWVPKEKKIYILNSINKRIEPSDSLISQDVDSIMEVLLFDKNGYAGILARKEHFLHYMTWENSNMDFHIEF